MVVNQAGKEQLVKQKVSKLHNHVYVSKLDLILLEIIFVYLLCYLQLNYLKSIK